ncbi:MAG: hypothetical protein HFG33_00800 [Bacilli bacterium]|nr:hypothetical protein [Bacilli bacterium]
MFIEELHEQVIPPNFLNSILTNPSLYGMFKDEFEENIEYFQGIKKEVYLKAMLEFIEDSLFSGFDSPQAAESKLKYMRCFYDDFLLLEFKKDPESLLKTRFFKGLVSAFKDDAYARDSLEFKDFYEYVFNVSLDYMGIIEVLTKDAIGNLKDGEELGIKEFNLMCNYVKNNIDGVLDMDIVTGMLKNHAFKKNHIFDRDVACELVSSTIKNYLTTFGIDSQVIFLDEDSEEEDGTLENVIEIDASAIDGFISLNYIELFEVAFMKADLLKDRILLKENRVDYDTLKVIMNFVSFGVDLERIFVEEEYKPEEYFEDLRASGFIKALRFFASFGVNLFSNYVGTVTRDIVLDDEMTDAISPKEICLDQRFEKTFKKIGNKDELLSRFSVLKLLFSSDGKRKNTLDLIKSMSKNECNRTFLDEYLHSRIIDPDSMVEDVNRLSQYKPKDEEIKFLIEEELKYIYVDSFFYSLDSFIKANPNMDIEEYLDDLSLKVNCIKDTPLAHRFIDEAIFTISDVKQSL